MSMKLSGAITGLTQPRPMGMMVGESINGREKQEAERSHRRETSSPSSTRGTEGWGAARLQEQSRPSRQTATRSLKAEEQKYIYGKLSMCWGGRDGANKEVSKRTIPSLCLGGGPSSLCKEIYLGIKSMGLESGLNLNPSSTTLQAVWSWTRHTLWVPKPSFRK